MKIGILHRNMGSLSGGCKCALDTAYALADHEITLYSSEKPNLQNWNYKFPFKFIQLPSIRYKRKMLVYQKIKSMIKYMDWLNDDIVITTFGQIINKPMGRLFQWLQFPYISDGWTFGYKFYRIPFDYLMKRTIKYTEMMLVFSEYVKRMTEKFFEVKPGLIEVIPLSVDVNSFIETREKNDYLVVTIASYSRWKHLEKVNEIARKCPQYRFIVIGRIADPVYFDYLKSIKANNVKYYVNLPNPIVKSILSEARYYLHVNYNYGKTYDAEHFGICIIEALASGCTVLAHNSGGPVEILDKGKFGFLYHKHDEVPSLLGSFFVKPNLSSKRAKMYDFSKFKKRLRKILLD